MSRHSSPWPLTWGSAIALGLGCSGPPPDETSAAAVQACDAPPVVHKIWDGTAVEAYLGLGVLAERALGMVVERFDDAGRPRGSCSGTMIAPGWVLTAAHCSSGRDAQVHFFPGGVAGGFGVYKSRRLTLHPTLDLMLLELEGSPADFSRWVAPIPLAHGTPALNDFVELAGFGVSEDAETGQLRFLVEALVEISDEALVVDGFGRTGACLGDSGGPLLSRDADGSVKLFGVLSAGSPDCRGRDIYTRIDSLDPFFSRVPASCADRSCGAISDEGRCFGERAVHCEAGSIVEQKCAEGLSCGWSEQARGFRCVEPSTPCSGFDAYGICDDTRALSCDRGRVTEIECASLGASCARGADGSAGCY